MAAWDKKPNPLIKKRLYNLMADNDRILTRILNISQKQLNQLLKLYAKHPEKLYKACQYWIAQGTLLNNANISDLATYINNMGTAYSIGLSVVEGTPIATQQAIKTVMQDSIMNYVTKVDNQTKEKLAKILTDGYDNKQMPRDTIKQMQTHLEHDKYRASMITHTETMRASNGASWSQAKAEGATHFIVDVRPGACKWCVKTFTGRVFKIDEVKYIPPLHPWCSCVPQFFFDEDEAQNAADEFKQRNLDEIQRLKDKGFEFPENGTGPLSPEAVAQRGMKPKAVKKNVPQKQSKTPLKEYEQPKINAYDRYALKRYQNNDYKSLNSQLRRGKVSKDNQELAGQIDKCFGKQNKTTLYRGMGNKVGSKLKEKGVGGIFDDKAFVSTSKSSDGIMHEGWRSTINTHEGFDGIDMNKALRGQSMWKKEEEILLPRNSKFKIEKLDTKNKEVVLTLL